MGKLSKNLEIGSIVIIVILAVSLLAFIFGWVDKDQLKDAVSKAVATVLVVVLASIAISSIADRK